VSKFTVKPVRVDTNPTLATVRVKSEKTLSSYFKPAAEMKIENKKESTPKKEKAETPESFLRRRKEPRPLKHLMVKDKKSSEKKTKQVPSKKETSKPKAQKAKKGKARNHRVRKKIPLKEFHRSHHSK
jgi:hypothetical protein